VAVRRQRSVAREILVVWALFAFVATEIFATYAREPVRELYHVSGSGPAAGLGRVVVFLNFPTALVALAVLPLVAGRLWPLAVFAAVLCGGVFWPGVVDQADLDVKWANTVPAAGVAIALGLTLWHVRRGAIAQPVRVRGDRWRMAIALLVIVVSLPWLAAELGLSFGDMGAWWAPLGEARVHHAVHHGHHHGMDGALFVLTALLLSRTLVRMPRALRVPVAVYLGILVAYGAANIANDAWLEQLVKRGWISYSLPSVLLPSVNLPWALIVIVGVGVGMLFLRVAAEGAAVGRRIPGPAALVPAAVAVALVMFGASQHRRGTAQTPFARSGSGTIVFPMSTEGRFHLYEIGADGRGLRQLTDEDASDLAPDWSPYGLLAFQSNRDDAGDVFVSDPDFAAVERVTGDGREGEPAWAPDGERIALVRDGDLYVVHAHGGGASKVADDAFWPSWAPGGSALAYEVHFARYEGVVTIAPGWSLGIAGTPHWRDPAWSPKGGTIAFECLNGDHWHICLLNAKSGSTRVLTPGGADEFAPAWSRDGRRIAFIGDRDGNDQLYVMRADGTGIVRLTTGQADKEAPAWRP
jgi:WD40-like Beta Propeller Repeat